MENVDLIDNIERENLFDAVTDAVIVYSPRGGFLDCNETALQRLGYTREEFLDLMPGDIIHPGFHQVMMGNQVKLLAGEAILMESAHRSKDGQVIPVEVNARRITYRGEPAILAVARNITERKQSEEALRVSEEKLKRILQSASDAITVTDLNGIIIEANDRTVEMHKFSSKENILGHSAFSLIADRDYERAAINMRKALDTGAIRNIEYTLLREDGTEFLGELSASVVRDTRDNPVGFIAITRDITERIQMREALQESEKRYRTLFEQAADSIVLIEPETGALWEFNERAYDTLGYTREEFKKLKLTDFEVIESAEEVSRHSDRILRKGTDSFETQHRTKTGKIQDVQVSSSIININGRDFIQSIWRDITNQKRSEKELKQYRNRLERLVEIRTTQLVETTEKLETSVAEHLRAGEVIKGLYTSEKELRERLERQVERTTYITRAVVHELKTPLTPLLGGSEILVNEVQGKLLQRVAANVYRTARNLNRRINDLMDITRGGLDRLRLRYSSVDVAWLLADVIRELEPSSNQKGQDLVLEITCPLPTFQADEDRLQQIVQNLLNNAIKFTRPGGRIVLKATAQDGNLIVEVEDNGRGIAKKDQSRLFEPYYTLDTQSENLGGLGLGLPLSKMLIDAHGGQIWMKSQKGKGSTFSFSIPLQTIKHYQPKE